MENKTRRVTFEVPNEFIELCQADGVECEVVLRGFIADLCGIENRPDLPARSDGYGSNGGEPRLTAMQYYVCVGYPWWRKG